MGDGYSHAPTRSHTHTREFPLQDYGYAAVTLPLWLQQISSPLCIYFTRMPLTPLWAAKPRTAARINGLHM